MTRLPTRYHVMTQLGTKLVAEIRAVYKRDPSKAGFVVAYDLARHRTNSPDHAQSWFRAIGCHFDRKTSAHLGTSTLSGIYENREIKAEAARLAATTQGKEGE